MEAFGVRYASLRSGAPLVAGAAIAALAALERNFDCFAPPVADHTAAAQILPPVPTAPSGLVAWCGGGAVSHPIRLLMTCLASPPACSPSTPGGVRRTLSAPQQCRFGAIPSAWPPITLSCWQDCRCHVTKSSGHYDSAPGVCGRLYH